MITYLRHADIDLEAWDRRLEACANASWYGLSATLEVASPGWDALVDERSGAQMPLPWRRKFGIRYLYEPFMIQHLGPYAPAPTGQIAVHFLQALPKRFRYADIYLQSEEDPALPGVRTEERINHLLRLDATEEALHAAYSVNHRRSLRKAAKLGVEVECNVESRRVITFLEGSSQFAKWGITPAQRRTMERVMHHTEADGTGFGRMVSDTEGPVATAWFVRWKDHLIFLKGLGSARGRELRAMHALIDHVLVEHASTGGVLDFAGGNDPKLARFYSGFGAGPVHYYRALVDCLPSMMQLMKK